ncbi:MAG: cyclic nucleotide-binding domain-containing protein [Thermoanaerobaculia bacterium]|nr:cyclic nucleotide-binding domain-containing protein [Thermoanaerobaculia bacterium]
MSSVLPDFEEFEGIDVFQKLPLFSSLNYSETIRLGAIARTVRREAGSVLVSENALGEALYVIRSGRVRVLKGEGDTTVALGDMGPGELFGEMSLVDDLLTSASVVALEPVELFVLPRKDFDALLAGDPGLALKVYKSFSRALSEKLRQLHQKLVPGDSLAIEGA